MENKMFCFQCQETLNCKGCTQFGVCGKSPSLSAMQDLLIYVTKALSAVCMQLRNEGTAIDQEINHLVTTNLFTTITNANFNEEAIIERIEKTLEVKKLLLKKVKGDVVQAALWDGERKDFISYALQVGVLSCEDEDIRSLRELITYGLKGLSAYTKHANVLLREDESIDAFIQEGLAATLDDQLNVDDLIALTLKTGEYGIKGMAMLDRANTEAYGHPQISNVSIEAGTRPGILISGHDLKDLELLLEQSKDSGLRCIGNRYRYAQKGLYA